MKCCCIPFLLFKKQYVHFMKLHCLAVQFVSVPVYAQEVIGWLILMKSWKELNLYAPDNSKLRIQCTALLYWITVNLQISNILMMYLIFWWVPKVKRVQRPKHKFWPYCDMLTSLGIYIKMIDIIPCKDHLLLSIKV